MRKVRNIVQDFIFNIIGNSVYDILKFLFTNCICISIVSFTTKKILDPYLPTIITILFTIIISIMFVVAIILGYRKYGKYQFKILLMNVNFEYMGDKVVVTTTNTIQSKRKNLNMVYHRYSWFEDEKTNVKCLTDGMKIKKLPKKDTSNEYIVVFGKKLKKGEKITYITQVHCENKHNHFKDFYSREIIIPMEHLTITVVIPAKFGYTQIERSKILGSAYSDLSNSETFSFLNTYTWDIDEEPRMGYEYKLHWKKTQ